MHLVLKLRHLFYGNTSNNFKYGLVYCCRQPISQPGLNKFNQSKTQFHVIISK